MNLSFEFETLNQKQIQMIKRSIGFLDKRLVDDINEQEVWDWIRDIMEEKKCSFAEATIHCYDFYTEFEH